MMPKIKTKMFDLLGASAAFLCMVHCIAFPLLMFIPAAISHNPYIDLSFLLIGIWSVYKTTRRSRSVLIKGLLWASAALIAVSILLHMLYHWHSPLMYIGAVGLMAGHFMNLRHHKH